MTEPKKLTLTVSADIQSRLKSYLGACALGGHASFSDNFLYQIIKLLEEGKTEWDVKLGKGSDV